MEKQKIKWLAHGMVLDKGHVTLVEICDQFPEEKGEMSACMPKFPNIVFWSGMSENLASSILELIAEKNLFIHPSSPLTYAIDGSLPQMEIAKSARQYKEPRWYPVVLHHQVYKE